MRTAQRPDSQATKTHQLSVLPLVLLDSAPAKLAQSAMRANTERSRAFE